MQDDRGIELDRFLSFHYNNHQEHHPSEVPQWPTTSSIITASTSSHAASAKVTEADFVCLRGGGSVVWYLPLPNWERGEDRLPAQGAM